MFGGGGVVDTTDIRQPLPAAMVARRLGVSRQLLNSWVQSGKLQPAEHTAKGRPLYRTIDAARVESAMRKSRQSRRNAAALIAA